MNSVIDNRHNFYLSTLVLCFVALLFNSNCYSQGKLSMQALHRHEINNGDTVYKFYAIIPTAKYLFKNTKWYFGYTKDTIVLTQGAVVEKILHGSYKVYYPGKNLKEEGSFTNGLKSGIWKAWFPNGQLRSVENWKKGELEGKKEVFNVSGEVIQLGNYKKSLFTGYIMNTDSSGTPKKVFYEKGKLKEYLY